MYHNIIKFDCLSSNVSTGPSDKYRRDLFLEMGHCLLLFPIYSVIPNNNMFPFYTKPISNKSKYLKGLEKTIYKKKRLSIILALIIIVFVAIVNQFLYMFK